LTSDAVMVAAGLFFKTLVTVYGNTRRRIPKDHNPRSLGLGNLKSLILFFFLILSNVLAGSIAWLTVPGLVVIMRPFPLALHKKTVMLFLSLISAPFSTSYLSYFSTHFFAHFLISHLMFYLILFFFTFLFSSFSSAFFFPSPFFFPIPPANLYIPLTVEQVAHLISLRISLFHLAFFNSIMDKTPTHALFYSTLY